MVRPCDLHMGGRGSGLGLALPGIGRWRVGVHGVASLRHVRCLEASSGFLENPNLGPG